MPSVRSRSHQTFMSSLNQMFEVLHLFSESKRVWTIDEATKALGQSRSTIYRYFRALRDAELLVPVSRGGYALGPLIIRLDRQIRLSDPLLTVAPKVMAKLQSDSGHAVILGRLFQNDLLCIHQEGTPDNIDVTFARGRPSSLFFGATPRVILANLPLATLRDVFLKRNEEIRAAQLGQNWHEFRNTLRRIRKDGYYVSAAGEVDSMVVGIGAPIFNGEANVVAGVTMAVPERLCSKPRIDRYVAMVRKAASKIGQGLIMLDKQT